MIHSMTAFTRQHIQADWGSATWEIRAVNHRYLDSSFRMPEVLRGLESDLRECFKDKVHRGKLECTLRFQTGPAAALCMQVNQPLVKAVYAAHSDIAAMLENTDKPRTMDIVRWPGVVDLSSIDISAVKTPIVTLFQEAIADLLAVRRREGEATKACLEERLTDISKIEKVIRAQYPRILEQQSEKLRLRFQEAKVTLDPDRLAQEMVLLAQKSDIAEELDRLKSHIIEGQRIVETGGVVGRRLDFLLQEFNREANTLGSKSLTADITAMVVDMKVAIEQLREQVQNIE